MTRAPLPGITAENYSELAKAFVAANGNAGFVIVRRDVDATTAYPPTPRQWGAWMGYFHSRHILHLTFLRFGRGTVPAEWPHQFDADWHPSNDEWAGDKYEATLAQENQRGSHLLGSAARQSTVKAALGYNPAKRDVHRYEGSPARVDISDFPNRNAQPVQVSGTPWLYDHHRQIWTRRFT